MFILTTELSGSSFQKDMYRYRHIILEVGGEHAQALR